MLTSIFVLTPLGTAKIFEASQYRSEIDSTSMFHLGVLSASMLVHLSSTGRCHESTNTANIAARSLFSAFRFFSLCSIWEQSSVPAGTTLAPKTAPISFLIWLPSQIQVADKACNYFWLDFRDVPGFYLLWRFRLCPWDRWKFGWATQKSVSRDQKTCRVSFT